MLWDYSISCLIFCIIEYVRMTHIWEILLYFHLAWSNPKNVHTSIVKQMIIWYIHLQSIHIDILANRWKESSFGKKNDTSKLIRSGIFGSCQHH